MNNQNVLKRTGTITKENFHRRAMNKDIKENKKTEWKNRYRWPFMLAFFLLAAGSIVFSVLCLQTTKQPFISKYATILSVAVAILIGVLCLLSVYFVSSNKETLAKTFFSGFILLLFCLILVYILLKTGFFEVVQSAERLQEYLQTAGVWMPIVYILLQYLQVIILPIPTFVSTVAGVALFGAFQATIYSLIGVILGSFTAFFIGRKLGYKAVAWMIGEETLKKWQKKIKGKDNLILTIMFILPLFPDDVLCFIAGLSSMSTKYFSIMLPIARVLGITGTCYSVDFIPFNTWWGLLIWGVFFALVIVAFFLVYKNMDRIQAWIGKKFKKYNSRKK